MKYLYTLLFISCSLSVWSQEIMEIKIGDQIWMAQNLNSSSFLNGEVIPEARTEAEWIYAGRNGNPAWCNYLNDSKLGMKFGKLYNWYAAADMRGICPSGWHLPTYKDWLNLSNFLGGDKVAGSKLKSKEGWDKNKNGNDTLRFTALPAGYRDLFLGTYSRIGAVTKWWCSREFNIGLAWMSSIRAGSDKLIIDFEAKENGYSVRCIKD